MAEPENRMPCFSVVMANERDNDEEKEETNDDRTGRIANRDCWPNSGRESIENCTNHVRSENSGPFGTANAD